jgi:hypothetical protein
VADKELAAINEERAIKLNVFGANQLLLAVELPFEFA